MEHAVNTNFLTSIVILLGFIIALTSLARRIHVPQILTYIVVGIVVGPFGFALIQSEENIHFIAELGIVFLLFAIGLEFSLTQMLSMRKIVFGLGGLQVLITGLFTFAIAQLFNLSLEISFIIASAFALSSTAIVIKQLTEQSEIQTRHGRSAVGILIFQDIIAIPLLIIIPALSVSSGNSLINELGISLLKGLVVVVVILAVGRYILRPLFYEVAQSKSQELFTLTVLTMVLAAAAFTDEMGISMTLGAFLAGMMLGETEFKHQIEADIRPFQDILLGLFFITVGMSISPSIFIENIMVILSISLAIILFKGLIIYVIMKSFKKTGGVSFRTAISLSQVGEFGLVIITLALTNNLLEAELSQILLSAIILSMMTAPFLIKDNGKLAKKIFNKSYNNDFNEIETSIANDAKYMRDHVVVLGFGRVGQTTIKFLENSLVPFMALDLDIKRVQEAQESGLPVFFGDAAKQGIISSTNLKKAKVAIITFTEPNMTIKVLKTLKNEAPDVPVIVRSINDNNLNALLEAGAKEVVPDTFESSIMLASHLLLMLGQPPSKVLKQTIKARENRYGLLEGFYLGEEDHIGFDDAQIGQIVHPVHINPSSFAVDKTLEELNLEKHKVTIKSIKRGSVRGNEPDPETKVRIDDNLIIQGLPEDIERAEDYIHIG